MNFEDVEERDGEHTSNKLRSAISLTPVCRRPFVVERLALFEDRGNPHRRSYICSLHTSQDS